MDKIEPIDEEYQFTGRVIVSETDIKGIIIYANRKFCEISGYSIDELIGKPHNIIRHPDMPKKAFETMWKAIENGKTWHGFVKNLRKDGKYYWVDTTISPSLDDAGNIKSYIAARKPASHHSVTEAVALYKTMLKNEQ